MTMSSRATKLTLFALIVGAGLCAALIPALRRSPPPVGSTNVVLIIVDTLRADHLGCYGYDKPTTTSIDEIARQGVVFEQTVANCSWTRPSIASLLTSTYPRETGVYKEQFDALSPEVVTLAEMFEQGGFATYGVTANPSINAMFGFDRGFDQYGDCGVVWPWMKVSEKNQRRYKKGVVLMEDADLVTDRALAILEQHDGKRPFYLQVLYIDPHLPYRPPKEFEHPLNEGPKGNVALYDAEVAFADQELGRLVDWITENHPDTLFVVTSDHGEGLTDHPGVSRSSTHGFTLYDSNLLVPLIFAHTSLDVGSRFPGQVQLLDLVPTLAELYDLPLDVQVQGTSLAPILRGGAPPQLPRYAFSDTQFNEVDKVSVREEDHKLILNRDHDQYRAGERPDLDRTKRASMRRAIEQCGPAEFYRLPGSENPVKGDVNLVDNGSTIEQQHRLEAALAEWERTTLARPPINRDAAKEISSTIIQQLEALGYLE